MSKYGGNLLKNNSSYLPQSLPLQLMLGVFIIQANQFH